MQLATLQLANGQIVSGRMCERVGDFGFERPVPFLQFRKMRLQGHVGGSPSSDRHLTFTVCHGMATAVTSHRWCSAAILANSLPSHHSAWSGMAKTGYWKGRMRRDFRPKGTALAPEVPDLIAFSATKRLPTCPRRLFVDAPTLRQPRR